MRVVLKNERDHDITLHACYDRPVIGQLLQELGYTVRYSDEIGEDVMYASKSVGLTRARKLASLVENCGFSCQGIRVLHKSGRTIKYPLRRSCIDVSPVFAQKNDLRNNQIVFMLFPGMLEPLQCTVCVNGDIADEDEIRVPVRYQRMNDDKVILMLPAMYLCSRVRVQKADLIKDDIVSVSNELYMQLYQLKPRYIEFRHLATGATMTRPFSSVHASAELHDDQIRLTHYQREILNISDKQRAKRSASYLSTLNDKVQRTNADSEPFIKEVDGQYSLTGKYNQVQLVPLYFKEPRYKSLWLSVCDVLVGGCEMKLTAVRPYKIDDARDIIRLSEDTMLLLGVEETDRVIVRYKDKSCKVSAMKIDAYHLMKETNILDSETDLDIIVGVPAPLRSELGIGDVETEVTVKRDTTFLFTKNLNIQLLSVLGLLLAVFEIGDGHFFEKCIVCVCLLPVIIFTSLSQERSKVKRRRRRGKGRENDV